MGTGDIILSTGYFPPISYIKAISNAGKVFIETAETYSRQSYRNRCRIMGPNGLQALVVPVHCPDGNHTPTNKVLIAGDNWKKLHWRSIETAYNASPFFLYYSDPIKNALFSDSDRLINLNTKILLIILELLQIKKEIIFTEVFVRDPLNLMDLRTILHPKKEYDEYFSMMPYHQVFSDRHGYFADLSIIDLLFNLGPEALEYLLGIKFNFQDSVF